MRLGSYSIIDSFMRRKFNAAVKKCFLAIFNKVKRRKSATFAAGKVYLN